MRIKKGGGGVSVRKGYNMCIQNISNIIDIYRAFINTNNFIYMVKENAAILIDKQAQPSMKCYICKMFHLKSKYTSHIDKYWSGNSKKSSKQKLLLHRLY